LAKAVDSPSGDDVLGKLSDLPQLSAFVGKCPLWTYVLAEAARTKTGLPVSVIGGKQITTPQLGPVGGRIVAEVFLGMLFGDTPAQQAHLARRFCASRQSHARLSLLSLSLLSSGTFASFGLVSGLPSTVGGTTVSGVNDGCRLCQSVAC
jgi:hypothetical protein